MPVPPLVALGLLLAEAALALLGSPSSVLAAAVVVLVPGLAVQPCLPPQLGPLGRWLAVPLVGCALTSIVLISGSRLGIPLTDVGVRVLLGLVVVAGLLASRGSARAKGAPLGRRDLAAGLVLGAVLLLAVALQTPVIGGDPVPGTDWGHYLLYPREVAAHHSLTLDNPYWMGGGHTFGNDPGVASLYGGFLVLSDADPTVLTHGIWVFALLAIVGVFVFVASLWGYLAGLLAAALYAAIPMNNTMLGWHGLANIYALCLLPLALVAAGWALRPDGRATLRGVDPRWSFVLALTLIALAAAHRLTLGLALAALAVTAVVALVLIRERRRIGAFALRTALLAAPLGAIVAYDLLERGEDTGGVQSYKVYLVTKVQLDLAIGDLTAPLAVAGVVALLLLLTRVRRDPPLLVLYGTAGGIALLGYGWIVHLPTVYYRAVYFVPLLFAAAIGIALTHAPGVPRLSPRALRPAAAVAAAVALFLGVNAVRVNDNLAPGVRSFYAWASDASLRGLAEVTSRTQPRELVVADRCWAFLAEWLLERPVLAGMDPADILPAWEAKPAAEARTVLYGSRERARELAARRGIRYGLINPGCESDETGDLRLPSIGAPVYQSTRLVVLDLTVDQGGEERRRAQRGRSTPLAKSPGAPGRSN